MSLKLKLNLISLIVVVFLILKTTVLLDITPSSPVTRGSEYILFLTITYFLYSFIRQYIKNERENKKLTEKITQKERALANRMDAINRSSPVIEFDTNGIVCFANDSFLDAMGYKSEEVIGKHHSIFVFDDEKNSDEYINFWNKLKSGVYFSGDIIRKKKDGNKIYLSATYNPIINEKGETYRVLKIARDISEIVEKSKEIEKQNTYLEHAAKILRHDMHSGINTYIPRGISSLERRLKPEDIETLKIEAPLKMIKEGLRHSQKVYKGVYEFTNLVKKDVVLNKTECNLKDILNDYLSSTAYHSQVIIEELPTIEVNEALFCTAIDNLIRNGLKYNDSETKFVKIYMEGDELMVQDNGRGIDQKDFDHLSKPYTRKEGQKESGTGLGLNICVAILQEHKFLVRCEKNEIGTKLKIKIK
jgi:PAS domain S-box-containing protein